MPDASFRSCWQTVAIQEAIHGGVALIGQQKAHYFLASHAPIQHIKGEKELIGDINEEALFQELIQPDRRNSLTVVSGEPGSGKSHLIHWLKLRFEYSLRNDAIKDIVPVLIARTNGSLKNALEQMIEQLPADYHHLLNPVRSAIEHLGEADARRSLALKLAEVLGNTQLIPDLPRRVHPLAHAPAAPGFGEWLCRRGGAVDRIIKLLTEGSHVDERQKLPEFTLDDVAVKDPELAGPERNPGQVVSLINNITDFPEEYGVDAVAFLNKAMPYAINQFTGLGTDTLRQILKKIRIQLAREGKSLAVFIEDVSTMTLMDTEVFLAFEPQDGPGMCPMLAVLGMVDNVRHQLRENQLHRISILVSVGKDQISRWRDDSQTIDKFVARYLNTIRLTDDRVRDLAERRRSGHDVSVSACSTCILRERCHSLFGKVTLDGVDVGLFPFIPGAPHRLLKALRETEGASPRQNPRGLLTEIVARALRDRDGLERGTFPQESVLSSVELNEPVWLSSFLQSYCAAGWSVEQKSRLSRLARGWITAGNAREAYQKLKPLCEAFGFPKLRDEAIDPDALWQELTSGYCASWTEVDRKQLITKGKPCVAIEKLGVPATVDYLRPLLHDWKLPAFDGAKSAPPAGSPEPPKTGPVDQGGDGEPKVHSHLQDILNNVTHWMERNNAPLMGDEEIRKLLADFVRDCFPWTDQTNVPASEWRRLLWGPAASTAEHDNDEEPQQRGANRPYAFIELPGMQNRPAAQMFWIHFKKDEDTRDLILALARFRYQGQRSFKFEDGETCRRTVAKAQRRLWPAIQAALAPQKLDTAKPIKSATAYQCASAALLRQAPLPLNPADLLDWILHDPDAVEANGANAPANLTRLVPVASPTLVPAWQSVLTNLAHSRRREVREFLRDEINLPQGKTGKTILINPVPVLRHARAFLAKPEITALDRGFDSSYWAPRYVRCSDAIRSVANFATEATAQRQAAVAAAESITKQLASDGYTSGNIDERIRKFGEDVAAMYRVMRRTDFVVPDSTAEVLLVSPTYSGKIAGWARSVSMASALNSASPLDILVYKITELVDAQIHLNIVMDYVDTVQDEVAKRENEYRGTGDPFALQKALLETLQKIVSLETANA